MSSLEVWDWRRRMFALYAQVRSHADPLVAHALWVKGRDELLQTHPASPVPAALRPGYPGAVVAPYDPDFRLVVPMDRNVDPERREHVTATDGVVPFDRIGRVHLGDLGSLDVWWLGSYGGGLFLPFRDRAPTSYGGGRYLLDTVKGADLGGEPDALVVDLNFAFQPSCAYDEAWACPLPGPGNTLEVEVVVGEQHVEGAAR